MNKKAQMSWIVKAIIAVVVLVILIAVFYGVGGRSVGKLGTLGEKTTTGADVETVKANCHQHCNEAKLITEPSKWVTSDYCKNSYIIDMNNDGDISDDEKNIKCYDPLIGIDCVATFESWGVPGYCNPNDCERNVSAGGPGCPAFICVGTGCSGLTSYSDCTETTGCAWEQKPRT